jgi:antibiotic biosynthesis monooxygenase (ABM) superfamily enzyme
MKSEIYPRRSCLKTVLAGVGLSAAGASALEAQNAAKNPIVLYVDMVVDPAKEKEMVDNYKKIFHPAAMKFPGYIDLKIVKLRSTLQGSAPASMNYRFQLTYESEEARQKWIHSDVHQKVWPTIEHTLTDQKNYTVLLCDAI